MAWEIWSDSNKDSSYGNIGFYCSSVGVSFGPVFMTGSDFEKGEFYDMWNIAGFKDPRTHDNDLWMQTQRIIKMMDWRNKISATMKVFRVGDEHPLIVLNRNESWDMVSFSPFHPALEESLNDDDFDTLNELIEGANADMKMLLISDFSKYIGSIKHQEAGIIIEIFWEVLND